MVDVPAAHDDWSAPVHAETHADDWSDPVHHEAPPAAGTHDHPLDDVAHAAGAGTIARASLAPDPQIQIKRYAEAFKQPESDFGIVGDHIVRKVPGSDQYARVEPSVRGGSGPLDTAERAMRWVAGGAGPAIPAVASGAAATAAAILAGPETLGAGSLPAAMAASGAGASAGEIARQKLDAALAPKGKEADMDWKNVWWQGAAGLTGPVIGKGVEALGSRLAPVLANAAADEIPTGAAMGGALERAALTEGTAPIAGNTAAAAAAETAAGRLKAAARAAYKGAEDAGVVISPESFSAFAQSLPDELSGYHPKVTTGAANIVDMLQDEAKRGPVTLSQLDQLRSVAGGASVGKDPNEARLAGAIVRKIDDYVDNLSANDLVSARPSASEPPNWTPPSGFKNWADWREAENTRIQGATNTLGTARDLWRRASKLQGIQDILDTAEDLDNPAIIKQKFTALVKNRAKFNQYDETEQGLIKKIAQTGTLDGLGKLAPDSVIKGIMEGGLALAHPAAAALPAIGLVSKYLADAGRQSNVAQLQDYIAKGGADAITEAFEKMGTPEVAQKFAGYLTSEQGANRLKLLYHTRPGTAVANSIIGTMLSQAGIVEAQDQAARAAQ